MKMNIADEARILDVVFKEVEKHYTPKDKIKTSRAEALSAIDAMKSIIIIEEILIGTNSPTTIFMYLEQVRKDICGL